MIGKLRGRVDSLTEDHVILDVNGVGYLVFAPTRVLQQLQGLSGEVALVIETHIREDHFHLYGFLSEAERAWFKLLMTVQGVGAKMALVLLSAFSVDEIADAIGAQDITMLTRASGVGKKLSERIVVELKNKVPAFAAAELPASKTRGGKGTKPVPNLREEAISALVNLGYSRTDAFAAVSRAAQDAATLDEMIRHSLKELAA